MPRPDHTPLAGRRARDLRSRLTVSEARLWGAIKGRATGARFRRQVPIGCWIVDFASLDPRIVIEVDDPSHHWRDERSRTEHLERLGFRILRFDNAEVAQELDAVVAAISMIVATSAAD